MAILLQMVSSFYMTLFVFLTIVYKVVGIFFVTTSSLLSQANCSDPTVPGNGSIGTYQNTTEGAEIAFGCNPGFVPAGIMTAVCTLNGSWTPDPAIFVCTCECNTYVTYILLVDILHMMINVSQWYHSWHNHAYYQVMRQVTHMTIVGWTPVLTQ